MLMFAPEASKHGNVMRVVIPKPAKERGDAALDLLRIC